MPRRCATILAAACLMLAGCSDSTSPPAVASVSVTAAATELAAGESLQLSAVARDAAGNVLSDRPVTWSSGNAAIASIDGTGLVTGVRAGSVTIIARAESQAGQLPLTITPAPIASLTTTPDTVTLRTGQTRQLTAIARDALGNVLSNRPVSWSSSDTLSARVSETGLVTTVSPGDVVITATAENRSSAARVTVLQVPVSSVAISPAAIMMRPAETRQLTAAVLDSAGNALPGRVVTWASSDTVLAQVTAAGVVSAVGEGQAMITAASEGSLATASITILPAGTLPVIGSIQPETLRPGMEAIISGAFFDPTAAGNTVTIRGVAAEILTASPEQLAVRVPCVGSGSVPVRVVAYGAASEPVSHPSAVPMRSLGVGQALILSEYEDGLCNEIPAGADTRYVVTVFNTSTSVNSLVDFRLGGNPVEASQTEPFLMTAAAAAATYRPRDEEFVRDSIHTAWLERERLLYQQLRSAAQQLPPQPSDAFAQQAALPNVGDMRSLFWNRGGCSDASQIIRGRAIYVGSRSIIWEDSANALQSTVQPQLADYYQRLGQIFDMEQYAVVRDNFGDPLRRDPVTDNDGRIHMVFTQRLNGSGAAAYVTSCDQFPRSMAPASNFGEFFYGFVPTQAGSNLNSSSFPDGWFNFMARTVVHEVKHIASHAARVANGAPAYEQSWLEEGTARHAEELWVRAHLHQVPWKGNTGFGTAANNGIYCDFSPADPLCMAADPLRRPGFGMRRHFNEIRDKLVAPWNFSPYGTGSNQTGSAFYQVSWSLVRYVIDRYGSSDAAFLNALNNSTTNGVTNLSSVAGASVTEMIGLWGLALYADDYPGLLDPDPDIQFPTWNLRDIYARLNQEPAWVTRFSSPFMLQPLHLPHGPFSTERIALRGGAHDYFVFTGDGVSPQLLRLEAPDGGAPSGTLRMGIARLR